MNSCDLHKNNGEDKVEQRKLRELVEQIPMEYLRLTQDLRGNGFAGPIGKGDLSPQEPLISAN